MTETRRVRRVLLALTETSPLERLWQSLTEHIPENGVEVVAVFVVDDARRRAASLPFTREISRFGGAQVKFTKARARQVDLHAVLDARQRLEQLAAATKLEVAFRTLADEEPAQVRNLADEECDILIAPSALEGRPLVIELARRQRSVILVEVDDEAR